MIVYFDTNVFRDLAEKTVLNAEKKVKDLKKFITDDKVIIAPSFEVLYELLTATNVDKSTIIENTQFYVDMVDWTYALKPSDQMLHDDILSLASMCGPSTPYRAIDSNQSGFIQDIKNGQNILPNAEWVKVVVKSRRQNETFVRLLFTEFVKKLPSKSKEKLKKFPEKTWSEWWIKGGLAEFIANTLVVPVVGKQIEGYIAR